MAYIVGMGHAIRLRPPPPPLPPPPITLSLPITVGTVQSSTWDVFGAALVDVMTHMDSHLSLLVRTVPLPDCSCIERRFGLR